MSGIKFLVKARSGELQFGSDAEIRDAFLAGKIQSGDLVEITGEGRWSYVADLAEIAPLFSSMPAGGVEKAANMVFVPGTNPYQAGPFTHSELKARIGRGEFAPATWVSLEGSAQWQQIRAVASLKEAVPPLPGHQAAPAAQPEPAAADSGGSIVDFAPADDPIIDFAPSDEPEAPAVQPAPAPAPVLPSNSPNPPADISLDANMGEASVALDLREVMDAEAANNANILPPPPSAPPVDFTPAPAASAPPVPPAAGSPLPPVGDDGIEREDPTMAISTLGLNMEVPKPEAPATPPPKPVPTPKPAATTAGASDFDGITVEIPMEPIWLVKQGASENVAGPFRFLEVVDFLKKGKLNKNDKISRAGTNRFQKITQQYEFNVSYSVENVVQGGVEKKKIFIRRRHPRVAYIVDVQINRLGQTIPGRCVNISAGGIMVEVPKAELQIGEALQIKILPGLIPRQISCGVSVTGKVPKIPPGFALKFETLSNEDKEAIEYFVSEALKREQAGRQTAV